MDQISLIQSRRKAIDYDGPRLNTISQPRKRPVPANWETHQDHYGQGTPRKGDHVNP